MNKDKYRIIFIILVAVVVGVFAYVFLSNNTVDISSISLESNVISLIAGESKKVNVTITPSNATDKTLLWESSNPGVANVTQDGTIMGISAGETIITVKSKDGNVYNKCLVKVVPKEANELEFIEKEIDIKIDDTKTLDLTISPEEFRKDVIWTSSDERIVIVDKNGIVTGISTGSATVKAIHGEKETECLVRVIIPIESLEMEKGSVDLAVGKTATINPTIEPSSASNQPMKWESSNSEIVSVENGIINGIREGTATITVSVAGKTASCSVNVIIPVDEIKLNKSSLSLSKGSSEQLSVSISPSNATSPSISWKSSNDKVVQVDTSGKVTGVGAGKATITVTSNGKTATSEVVVYNLPMTSNSKYTSGYSNIASYNSETLKYRIMKKGKNEYTLVWVLDSNKQWNSAMPKLGKRYKSADILSQEIKKYGYEKKGLVATNGSAFWDGWGDYPCSAFLINKGKIVSDIKNITYQHKSYGTVGITKDGILKLYRAFSQDDYSSNVKKKQQMLDNGVRNNFAIFNELIKPNGQTLKSNIKIKYTGLCQVDENNFVIYSGETLTLGETALLFKNTFNCRVGYRFDGGSSTTLYYKTGSMSTAKAIHNGRDLPDMMYFVEQ